MHTTNRFLFCFFSCTCSCFYDWKNDQGCFDFPFCLISFKTEHTLLRQRCEFKRAHQPQTALYFYFLQSMQTYCLFVFVSCYHYQSGADVHGQKYKCRESVGSNQNMLLCAQLSLPVPPDVWKMQGAGKNVSHSCTCTCRFTQKQSITPAIIFKTSFL